MNHAVSSLSYAVRPRVLHYYLSRLSLVLGCLTVVPLGVALALGELRLAGHLAAVVGVTLALWLTGLRSAPPAHVQANEALAVAALAFVITPLLMAAPMATAGLAPEDALFESVSAVTTTGLSTLRQVEGLGKGFLFLRAWMQWYGGLGIAVFSLALVMGHHSGARRLAEVHTAENLPTSARAYARQVLKAYLALTLVALAALWPALGDGFEALAHVLAGVSTGGFSTHDGSLADMGAGAGPYAAVGAGVLGALPLLLYYQLATGRRRDLRGDPEVWALFVVIGLVAAALTLSLHYQEAMGWGEALRHGLIMGASAQTTTGYSSLEPGRLGETSKLVLIFAMFAGGSVGSTAGGIKLLRLLILAELLRFMLRRSAMPPHAVAATRLGGRNLEPEEIQRALVIVLLFGMTVAASWLALVAGGHPALEALFEVVSATATVGLSTGITAPGLDTGLKLLLCLDMLLGRLEIFALLVVMYPPTWLGRRSGD